MIWSRYAIILVYSTSHAFRAEQILLGVGINSKLIPAPRHLSSDCAVCLRIEQTDLETARQELEGAGLEVEEFHVI